LGDTADFYSIGLGEAAMKQTVMWLAFTLLFAIITLSITAYSFGPAATAETAGPATVVEAPQPVVAATAKPAQPEIPVAMLDDVSLKPTIGSEAFARWIPEPGASAATGAAEAPVAPLPLAAATTTIIAGHPGRDAKAGIKPLEGNARPARRLKDSKAELPGKRSKPTANARACGSTGPFTDLLRRLNLTSRCSTRRSAA
jgi:hypothetical protein